MEEKVQAGYPAVAKIEMDPKDLEALWMGNVYPLMLAAQQTGRWDIALGGILACHAMFNIQSVDQVINSFSNIQQITNHINHKATLGTNELLQMVGLTPEEFKRIQPRMQELQRQAAASSQN